MSVVLGGLGDPPSEPGTLLGLAPFDVGYSWDGLGSCYGPFDDFFAELGSCENLLEVDEYSWSWGQPGLEYRIVDGNMIELKWRAGSPLVLYSAPVLDRADSKRVIGDHYANGFRVLRVSATEPQRYYWLAQPADD